MGLRQYWSGPVPPMNSASGPAVTAAALTDASPAPPVIVPGSMLELGTELRIRAHGEFTLASGSPTCVFGLYWGGIAGVVIAASFAVTLPVGTGWPWMLEWDGECRGQSTVAGGNTGSVNGQGKLHMSTSLTAFAAPTALPLTKALRTVAIDTSLNKVLSLGVTLSTVTGTPSVTCDDLVVELLG